MHQAHQGEKSSNNQLEIDVGMDTNFHPTAVPQDGWVKDRECGADFDSRAVPQGDWVKDRECVLTLIPLLCYKADGSIEALTDKSAENKMIESMAREGGG